MSLTLFFREESKKTDKEDVLEKLIHVLSCMYRRSYNHVAAELLEMVETPQHTIAHVSVAVGSRLSWTQMKVTQVTFFFFLLKHKTLLSPSIPTSFSF